MPDFSYTRVFNGFSAALDARAVALLERARGRRRASTRCAPRIPAVALVGGAAQPPFAPAAAAARRSACRASTGAASRSRCSTPASTSRSPTSAAGCSTGLDIVDPERRGDRAGEPRRADAARAPRDADGRAARRRGRPGRAPGRRARRAGPPDPRRRLAADAEGGCVVYARTDQLIAGLERAVDPDGDGDVHDAARIALVGVAEPFASFADGPIARAVEGALALDTLVVAPAGNDGAAGPELRQHRRPGRRAGRAHRRRGRSPQRHRDGSRRRAAGLDVLLDRGASAAGCRAPSGPLALTVVRPRRDARRGHAAPLARYFDAHGLQPRRRARGAARRARREPGDEAALPPRSPARPRSSSTAPSRPARSASNEASTFRSSGSRAGRGCAALGARPTATRSRLARRARRGGRTSPGLRVAAVLVARPRLRRRRQARGRGAGGRLVTADPGTQRRRLRPLRDDQRHERRRGGGRRRGRGARTGAPRARRGRAQERCSSARRASARSAPTAAQGAGDVDRSLPRRPRSSPSRDRRLRRRDSPAGPPCAAVVVRNVSTRRVAVDVAAATGRSQGCRSPQRPRALRLQPGASAPVDADRARRLPPAPASARSRAGLGWTVSGGGRVIVPWAIAFPVQGLALIGGVSISARAFRASDRAPAVLSVQAGQVRDRAGRRQIVPALAARRRSSGAGASKLGLLARLRDVLPGRLRLRAHRPRPAAARSRRAPTGCGWSPCPPDGPAEARPSASGSADRGVHSRAARREKETAMSTAEAPTHLRENPLEMARQQLRRVGQTFGDRPQPDQRPRGVQEVGRGLDPDDDGRRLGARLHAATASRTTSPAARRRAASATTRPSRSTRSRRSRCG